MCFFHIKEHNRVNVCVCVCVPEAEFIRNVEGYIK